MNQETSEIEFTKAFAEYGDAIFRFCFFKVSDTALAEDMTQEVFTRYWLSLRDGKSMTNTRAFLYTIANNLAKDWYKKKKSVSLDARFEAGQQHEAEPLSGPETMAAYQEVLQTIGDLEQTDKEVLLLSYVEGYDPKTIASLLGETANVISVRLHRATKRLQQKLHV